jgi:hypothetical protein
MSLGSRQLLIMYKSLTTGPTRPSLACILSSMGYFVLVDKRLFQVLGPTRVTPVPPGTQNILILDAGSEGLHPFHNGVNVTSMLKR